jgi:luciferase family oxidoreductase group 1
MPTPPTPLSILDLSPVVTGQSAAEALRNTVELARHAEQLGYRRYWLAEHHLAVGAAAASPAVLIAAVAEATSKIRVGSGAVLLGHHPPLVVAEQFGTLAHLHPGRIDLGLGRSAFKRPGDLAKKFSTPSGGSAPESKVVDGLLVPAKPEVDISSTRFPDRVERQQRLLGTGVDSPGGVPEEYRDQVEHVLQFVGGEFRTPEGEPVHATPAEGADLDVWILGSSAGPSSAAAGALGLPFAANYHVSPSTVLESVAAYREAFVPSTKLNRPHVSVSADVVVADTDAAARELASPYGQWVLSVRNGEGAIRFPSPTETAEFRWTEEQRSAVADRVDTQIVGSPETVVRKLTALRDATGADELVITTITHDHVDRIRSYELLAEAWQGGSVTTSEHSSELARSATPVDERR